MPQMSPMNWIIISTLFLLIYKNMKIKLNSNFKSKINNTIKLNVKKNNISW